MNLLYLTILFPLISSVLLSFFFKKRSENFYAIIGVGSVFLSFIVSIFVSYKFLLCNSLIDNYVYKQALWICISINDFKIPFVLLLDGLSLTMLCIITGVGFLIHIYASWYMRGEKGYSRFFIYTNLFISCMVLLVLGDNMISMYFGWEGVGLCSYLLINFYYNNFNNGKKAIKAFLITRTSDVFFVIGMIILWNEIGTLNFNEITNFLNLKNIDNSFVITLAVSMFLIAAITKSAQFPLQTWITDAMVGPLPVSALIHASTMVTAGVYLISRMHLLFLVSTGILYIVSVIGVISLIVGGLLAILQSDIKRILAYSTVSQIGYMFLALGVKAWSAAIFHLMIHSFFKSLLFLSVGSVIVLCNYEQNIFKIRNILNKNLFIYIIMLIAGSSLSALPLFTSGFYSKSIIFSEVNFSGQNIFLYISIFSSFITSIYIFRMIFTIFCIEKESKVSSYKINNIAHTAPLVILAIFSTFIGALIHQPLEKVFPIKHFKHASILFEIISSCFSLAGLIVSILIFLYKRTILKLIKKIFFDNFLIVWFSYLLELNWLYDIFFIKPFKFVVNFLKKDPINLFMNKLVYLFYFVNNLFSISENGQIRWYITSFILGTMLIISLLLLV